MLHGQCTLGYVHGQCTPGLCTRAVTYTAYGINAGSDVHRLRNQRGQSVPGQYGTGQSVHEQYGTGQYTAENVTPLVHR